MYDVLIIGAGIVGTSLAYYLGKYNLNVCVCDRYNDVANGATKANSAILHAGFDCPNGTIEAKLNLRGVELAKSICQKLDVERREIPSFVLAFTDEDIETVNKLYKRGIANGVKGLEILNYDEVLKREPAINPKVKCALFASTSAIVNPWEYAIAMAETSALNGVQYKLSTAVEAIEGSSETFFTIHTNKGDIKTKFVVNAAGAFSADVYKMVGGNSLTQTNSCGQYYVLDKDQGKIINSIVFQCPTKLGKGVLVAPTIHGNLIVGPDAFTVDCGDSVATVEPFLSKVKESGLKSVPGIDFRKVIHEYAGVRPNCQIEDFIIEEAPECKGFINLAGIRSPGLSSAPAIAEEALKILEKAGLELKKKDNFTDSRHIVRFRQLSKEQQEELIKQNPLYGRVICRCETITEAEIVNAIHSPIVPTTIDAIKRRCNAGMGRCQGGFCGPKVHEIIARELGMKQQDVLMDEEGSYIITSEIKKATEER